MSYNSSNTTSSAPQHRLHSPNEPLPGSQNPTERGKDCASTECLPPTSYSSSHSPNEPLPGSQHPIERGEARVGTERSPQVSYSSSERPVSSDQPSSVGANAYASSDNLTSDRPQLPVERSADHVGTERSPQVSYSSSERPASSDQPGSVGTNPYAPSDNLASERSQLPVERSADHIGTQRSPQASYSSSERPVSSDQPGSVGTNPYAPSDNLASERSQLPVEGGADYIGTQRSPQVSYSTSERPVSSDRPSSVETNVYAPSDDPRSEQSSLRGVVSGAGSTPPVQDTLNFAGTQGRSAYNTARPLGVEPTSTGQSTQSVRRLMMRCCAM